MAFFVIQLVIMIVLFVASVLLMPKPDLEAARPKGLGDIQAPTADETRPVPILWGTMDIKGPNVIWYGDLSTVKLIQKINQIFSTKTLVIGFRYFIGIDLLLCYGEIDRVVRLEVSDKVATTTIIGPFTDAGLDYSVDQPNLLGGKEKGGGVVGTFKIYGGRPNQDKDPYLIANGPAQGDAAKHPAYVDIAHAVWLRGETGESPNLGKWVFRVTRFPTILADTYGATLADTIINGDVENGDANPAEVIFEVLTNEVWGVGLPVIEIDVPSFVTAHATLATEGNGVSMIIDRLISGEDIIVEILKQIDAALYQDSAGVFTIKLVRDDYNFATLPILNESNIIKLKEFSRGGWSSTRNHVNIKYNDRNQDFIGTGAMAQDTANFRVQGIHVRDDQSYGGVKVKQLARDIAARELRVAAFPLAKIMIDVNREGFALAPGDVFRLQWADLGITDMVMRVGSMDLGNMSKGAVSIAAIQDIFAIGETVFGIAANSDWTPVDTGAIDGVGFVRPMPLPLMLLDPETFPAPITGARLLSLVQAPNGTHVSFTQFIDFNQTGDYIAHATGAMSAHGFTTAAWSSDTPAIDTVGFTLENTEGMALLTNASASDIANGFNLGIMLGGSTTENGRFDEIFGWETVVDNGDGTFTFTNVHRALGDGNVPSSTLTGRRVMFLTSPAISSEFATGETMNVKYLTETTQDTQTVAEAFTLVWESFDRHELPPGSRDMKLNGSRIWGVDDIGGNDATFTWKHRRSDEVGLLDDDVASAAAQDTDVRYRIEFRRDDTGAVIGGSVGDYNFLANTSPPPTNGTWTSFTYTRADIKTDTGAPAGPFLVRFEMQSEYLSSGLLSLVKLKHTFSVTLL